MTLVELENFIWENTTEIVARDWQRDIARAESAETRVADIERQLIATVARAEAAEAEVAKWREMHDDRDKDLAHEYARANTAEAEVERLREALADAKAEGANEERSLHWMQADAEVQRLRALWARAWVISWHWRRDHDHRNTADGRVCS